MEIRQVPTEKIPKNYKWTSEASKDISEKSAHRLKKYYKTRRKAGTYGPLQPVLIRD